MDFSHLDIIQALHPKRSRRLVMPMLYLPVLATLLCSVSNGQELSPPQTIQAADLQGPRQSASIQANGVQDSIQPPSGIDNPSGHVLQYGPFNVQLDAQGSAVYNDNIFIQHSDKTSDLIWTAAPDVSIGAGDYFKKEESWLTIDYAPSLNVFTDHSNYDALDENAIVNFEWRPASWTFGIQQQYQELSGPIVEAGNRVNRSIYDTDLYVKYDICPKTSLEIDATQSINDYDRPLFSYNTWTVDQWVDYWLTPKIKVGVGAIEGFLDVSQNPNQTYQQGVVRSEYDLSEVLTFRGSAGVEYRQFQSGENSRLNGAFSFGGTYKPRVTTDLLFDAYRRDESSLVLTEENYTVTGFSVGVRQAFSENYIFSLTSGFNHSDYYATAPGVTPSSGYNYFFVRPGIDRQIGDQFTVGIFYQYQASISSEANDFNNNLTGVNLGYHF